MHLIWLKKRKKKKPGRLFWLCWMVCCVCVYFFFQEEEADGWKYYNVDHFRTNSRVLLLSFLRKKRRRCFFFIWYIFFIARDSRTHQGGRLSVLYVSLCWLYQLEMFLFFSLLLLFYKKTEHLSFDSLSLNVERKALILPSVANHPSRRFLSFLWFFFLSHFEQFS